MFTSGLKRDSCLFLFSLEVKIPDILSGEKLVGVSQANTFLGFFSRHSHFHRGSGKLKYFPFPIVARPFPKSFSLFKSISLFLRKQPWKQKLGFSPSWRNNFFWGVRGLKSFKEKKARLFSALLIRKVSLFWLRHFFRNSGHENGQNDHFFALFAGQNSLTLKKELFNTHQKMSQRPLKIRTFFRTHKKRGKYMTHSNFFTQKNFSTKKIR